MAGVLACVVTCQAVLRFGWQEAIAEDGSIYFVRTLPPYEDATWQKPGYDLAHYYATCRIQRRIRKYMQLLHDKRMSKLEDLSHEVDVRAKEWEARLADGHLIVRCNIGLAAVEPTSSARRLRALQDAFAPDAAKEHLETLLPKRLQADWTLTSLRGQWIVTALGSCLYASIRVKKAVQPPAQRSLRTKAEEAMLVIETTAGETQSVQASTALLPKLCEGMRVEVREAGTTNFYRRAVILNVVEVRALVQGFDVRYDDGEVEKSVLRPRVRLTREGSQRWGSERDTAIRQLRLELQRRQQFVPAASSSQQSRAVVNVKYSRMPVRYEWRRVRSRTVNRCLFVHRETGEVTDSAPFYSPEEDVAAQRFQLAWYRHRARCQVQKMVNGIELAQYVRSMIEDIARRGYIGYRFEGMSGLLWLRRVGLSEIADKLKEAFRHNARHLRQLTASVFLEASAADVAAHTGLSAPECLLISQAAEACRPLRSSFSSFASDSAIPLSFVNYFRGTDDERSLGACIQQSEPLLYDVLLQRFPNASKRVQAMARKLSGSRYPVTFMQLDMFCRTYAGKPAQAQERVHLLVGVCTLEASAVEQEILKRLRTACTRLTLLLKVMKLHGLRELVLQATQRATAVHGPPQGSGEQYGRATEGKAGQAAYLLRTEILDRIQCWDRAALRVQTQYRRFSKAQSYRRVRAQRRHSAIVIQCVWRQHAARAEAAEYRAQLQCDWEQLWDDRRQLFYYFHNKTLESSYRKPDERFRPMVRDRLSWRLVPAWWHLTSQSQDAGDTSDMQHTELCSVCRYRTAIRACQVCKDNESVLDQLVEIPRRFCYPCWWSQHVAAGGLGDHLYTDLHDDDDDIITVQSGGGGEIPPATAAAGQRRTLLSCCQCGQPASRKCLGLLDETNIKAVIAALVAYQHEAAQQEQHHLQQQQRTGSWWLTSRNAGVEIMGKRKLQLLLRQLPQPLGKSQDKPNKAESNSVIVQKAKEFLERTNAECDECYCARCYRQSHGAGKRLNHRSA